MFLRVLNVSKSDVKKLKEAGKVSNLWQSVIVELQRACISKEKLH